VAVARKAEIPRQRREVVALGQALEGPQKPETRDVAVDGLTGLGPEHAGQIVRRATDPVGDLLQADGCRGIARQARPDGVHDRLSLPAPSRAARDAHAVVEERAHQLADEIEGRFF